MEDIDGRVCVVTGVGPGTGAALARRFAAAGYRVALLARSVERLESLAAEIEGSRAYPTDVSDPGAVLQTFASIRAEMGPVRVLLHNAGSARFGDFSTITPELFEEAWRVNTLGLMVCGQEAARDMVEHGGGSILVTGATASLRGGEIFAAFAPAKAAQRSLAQSMARHLGPKGVHVAYAIVDGVIDMPTTRQFMPDRPEQEFLAPSAIADAFYNVAHQSPSAWTFEFDLRPFGEKW